MDSSIHSVADKIRSLKTQGATNTAIATIEALAEYAKTAEGDIDDIRIKLEQIGHYLAHARPTEPMARNGVKYVLQDTRNAISLSEIKKGVASRATKFLKLVEESKKLTEKYGAEELDGSKIIMSHCHSSTVVSILKAVHQRMGSLTVITTETRPLFQGRKTAVSLLEGGVDVIMIVDNAASMFLADDSFLPVDAVVIGCDEFTAEGDAINKVGSFPLALAAKYSKKPIYVLTPLLKAGTETLLSKPIIEKRPCHEVWEDAPEKLQIINPAFELVPARFITAYITEEGVIQAKDVFAKALERYPYLK